MSKKEKPTTFRKAINVDDIITENAGLKAVVPETRRKRNTALVSSADLPKAVRKEISQKGIKALNDKRQEAKTYAEAFSMLADIVLDLDSDQDAIQLLSQHGIKPTERQIVAFRQMQMAKQDTKAFTAVRDSMGEKPVEKQEVQLETRDVGAMANRWLGELEDNE